MPPGLGLGVGINAVSFIRKLRVGLLIGALIILSPLAAAVIVISGEIGLDLVAQARTAGVLDLGIAAVIGWMVLKNRRRMVRGVPQQTTEQAADDTAIASSA